MLIKKSFIKKIAINSLFVILLFLMCLDSITVVPALNKFLRYIDELLTILLAGYVLYNCKTIVFKKKYLLIFFMGLLFVGMVSSAVFQYQSMIVVLIDAFIITARFIIGYLAGSIYVKKTNMCVSDQIERTAKVIVIGLFIIAIHDLILPPFFAKSDYRYFTYGLQLMFPHATFLAATEAALLIFLGYRNIKNKNIWHMLMSSFVGVMTLRGKAIAFFAVYWFVYILVIVLKERHYQTIMIGGSLALGLLIGWDRINANYNSVAFRPRSIMLKDGIQLMKSHFPFGTGFGSYGSTLAVKYYSPLYRILGYENLDGMSPQDSRFLHDGFWHTICAQFGIIGLIFFLLIIAWFLKCALNRMKRNRLAGVAMITPLIYLLIASTGEAAFFSPTALIFFMMFAVFEKEDIEKIEKEKC